MPAAWTFVRLKSKPWHALVVVSLIAISIISLRAIYVRPLADDYCIAASLYRGPFGAFNWIYQSWSGDLLQIAGYMLLVGIPIYFLPYSLYALVPLLVVAVLLTGITYVLLRKVSDAKESTANLVSFSIIFSVIAWPAYWISQRLFDYIPLVSLALKAEESSHAALEWSTLISQYIAIPALLLLFYFFTEKLTRLKYKRVAISFLGILIGLSGYALALSLVTYLVLSSIRKNRNLILNNSLIAGFTLISVLFSITSSGARNRVEALGQTALENFNLSKFALRFVSEFTVTLINPGTLLGFF
ncbi:hypothetical protein MCEMRE217_00048 [Candidatus Nanopelagicaceae bacterium]